MIPPRFFFEQGPGQGRVRFRPAQSCGLYQTSDIRRRTRSRETRWFGLLEHKTSALRSLGRNRHRIAV